MLFSSLLIAGFTGLGLVTANPVELETRAKKPCKKSNSYTAAPYTYQTQCGYNVTGGSIFTDAKPPNFYGCVQSCSAYDQCTGAVWDIQYSVCELYQGTLKFQKNAGTDAAIVISGN